MRTFTIAALIAVVSGLNLNALDAPLAAVVLTGGENEDEPCMDPSCEEMDNGMDDWEEEKDEGDDGEEGGEGGDDSGLFDGEGLGSSDPVTDAQGTAAAADAAASESQAEADAAQAAAEKADEAVDTTITDAQDAADASKEAAQTNADMTTD